MSVGYISILQDDLRVESGVVKLKDKNIFMYKVEQDLPDKNCVTIEVTLHDRGRSVVQKVLVDSMKTLWRS